jgi:molybdopterin synthase catalytic subunit
MVFHVAIENAPIDPSALQAAFSTDGAACGAVVTFTGRVRGGDVTALALEHYPQMTERSILSMMESAARRWPVQAMSAVHRVGELAPGEPIVWLGVAAAHRAAAFSACEYLMDYLKVAAPLWKRERDRSGAWHWVTARAQDGERARRWGVDAHGAARSAEAAP